MKIIRNEKNEGMAYASNEQLLHSFKLMALIENPFCYIENGNINNSFYVRGVDSSSRDVIQKQLKDGLRDGCFNAIKATSFKNVSGGSADFLVTYKLFKDY